MHTTLQSNKKIIFIFLVCLLLGIVHFFSLSMYTLDTDFFWHYKLGEEIVKTHNVVLSNTLSFLTGTEWIPQEWLYEVVIYLLVSAGGMAAFCLIYAVNSIFQYLLAGRMSKPSNYVLFSICVFIVLLGTPRNAGNRPAELSIYLFPAIIFLYKMESKWKPLYFILLGIFTANFHGGCILVMTALYVLLFAANFIMDAYEQTYSGSKYYLDRIIDFILFLAACCINPAGIRLLTTIPKISRLSSTAFISEWQSIQNSYGLCIVIVLICISFGYALYKKHFIREDVINILILAALLILGLCSGKAFMIFDIVWLCYGYKYLEDMLTDLFLGHILISKKTRLLFLFALLPAAIVFSFQITKPIFQIVQEDFITYANSTTSEVVLSELKANYNDSTRILSSYTDANYLILNDMKCFVDSRQWPYAKELGSCDAVDELFYISSNPLDYDAIDQFLGKYQFDYIWCANGLALDDYLKSCPEYELVIEDNLNKSASESDTADLPIYERDNSMRQSLWKRI